MTFDSALQRLEVRLESLKPFIHLSLFVADTSSLSKKTVGYAGRSMPYAVAQLLSTCDSSPVPPD